MARQHPLGTIKNVATRIARTAAKTAGRLSERAVDEVNTRIGSRRAGPPEASRPPAASGPVRDSVPTNEPAGTSPPNASRGVPLPTDVARVVARNAAGLPRVTPTVAKRKRPRISAPGAKLPARSGQGIVGM